MALYLAVDLGTTGCRCAVYDSALTRLGDAYEEYELITPREGFVEQDANRWWELTLRTAEGAMGAAGVSPQEIRGIAVSSQGLTVVPVDQTGEPLCNAISWLDGRTTAEVARLAADFGEQRIFALTGKPLTTGYTLPMLLWLQENRPEIFAAAYQFLLPLDFLTMKLTGNYVTDHTMASGTMLYDLSTGDWCEELLDFYGIEKARLPRLLQSGAVAGTVTPAVCARLGLSPDCVVAVGAQDQKCAAFGAGLAGDTVTVSLGTAAAITATYTGELTAPSTGIPRFRYVLPEAAVSEGVIGTAGTCLRWVRDVAFAGESYRVIDAEAAAARDRGSSVLFYPFMAGATSPDFYPQSQGCFYGVTLASGRGDLALAVMEGVAFQLRTVLQAMNAYETATALTLFGGGAGSPLWAQIMADITGLTVQTTESPEAAAAGAARLAALAAGEALPALTVSGRYVPSGRQAAYAEKYAAFRRIERQLWEKEADR